MTQGPCDDLVPHIIGRSLGLGEERGLERLARHLGACPECAARDRQLDLAVAAAGLSDDAPPADGWERLAARIEREVPAAAEPSTDGPRLRVTLTCTYCRDGLTRACAHFCANCLAPHHRDCFEKHGRCSAPGCGGSQIVHTSDVGDSSQRSLPPRWGRWAAAAAGLLVAALLPVSLGVSAYVERVKASSEQGGERVEVFVASRDLSAGRVLTGDDVETSQFPRALLERALQGTWVKDRAAIVGSRLSSPIKAGQVLTVGLFARGESAVARSPATAVSIERALRRYATNRRLRLAGAEEDPYERVQADLADARAGGADPALTWYLVGEVCLDAQPGDAGRAEAALAFGLARKAEPEKSPMAALILGRMRDLAGREQEALALYSDALERDPTLRLASLARGALRIRVGDFGGALRDAEPLTKDPLELTYASGMTLRAWARFQLAGDRVGAMLDLDCALVSDPVHPEALAYRAFVRLEFDARGQRTSRPNAIALSTVDAETALRLDPTLSMAHRALALIHERSEPLTALAHADRAVDFASEAAWSYRLRARLRIRDGDLYRASEDLKQTLTLTPEDAKAMTMLAGVCITRREFEQAKSLLDSALSLDPGLAQAHFNLGYLLLRMRSPARQIDYQRAIESFSRAVGLAPTFGDAYFYRAVAQLDLRRFEDCLSDLERADGLRGSSSRVSPADFALVRGHCNFAREEWRQALTSYVEFIRVAPVGSTATSKVRRRIAICERKIAEQEQDGGD